MEGCCAEGPAAPLRQQGRRRAQAAVHGNCRRAWLARCKVGWLRKRRPRPRSDSAELRTADAIGNDRGGSPIRDPEPTRSPEASAPAAVLIFRGHQPRNLNGGWGGLGGWGTGQLQSPPCRSGSILPAKAARTGGP